ncbi:DUF6896 domain-containing protein [Streptomyces sedi]|uniref:DUF6896 domain-containing protein n=1 Tax=Streptomyces sedi TaxID=555059 RepID=A0A5C4V8I1_9ACTN|nr:hypothetical protein [Streptomyces sedi]TNM32242.1 hypothetical protein FH715_07560 [Streptomyces sedi]
METEHRDDPPAHEAVDRALSAFREGRRAMARRGGVASVEGIVGAVLRGALPRAGRTGEGWEYQVHGIGYTVTLADGGDVHLDAAPGGGACFRAFDVRQYLESASDAAAPAGLGRLGAELRRRAGRGELTALPGGGFLLPEG